MSGEASGNSTQQPPLQLLAYTDASVAEGSEAEQLLACFPSSVSAEEQISATGLMQAIFQFSSSFSKARTCLHALRLSEQGCVPLSHLS